MSGMPKTSDGSVIYRDAAEWFKHRSYDYRQFSDLSRLPGHDSHGRIRAEGVRAPQSLGLRLGVVLELDPLQPLLAQRCANQGGGFVDSDGARMTTVSFPVPQRNSISRGNLRGRSPP
jgi:hypothetical protein